MREVAGEEVGMAPRRGSICFGQRFSSSSGHRRDGGRRGKEKGRTVGTALLAAVTQEYEMFFFDYLH